MSRLVASIIFSALSASQAVAATTTVAELNPGAYKLQNGQINEVMVLGTAHLSQLPKSFDGAKLNSLIERLTEWKPQAIAIEAVSGLQCAYMRSYPQRYSGTIKSYCWDPAPANAATGLDVVAANIEAERMLASWPASPSPAQRRKLASLFLAAGERPSALVQWLRLPAGEQHAGDGLNDDLVNIINKLRERRSEDSLLSAILAAKSGHERLYSMDDHTADMPDADPDDQKASSKAVMKAWNNPSSAERQRLGMEANKELTTPAGVLSMYRVLNQQGMADLTFRSDFGAALEESSPKHYGRQYVAYWEVRNLRMTANIREVMEPRPGIRTLVIVGASHKAYLEAYLNQMHDVRIVPTDNTLR